MDFRDIQKEAKKQGWTYEKLASGHWRFVPPDPTQDLVHASGTPSGYRSIKNFLA